MQDTILYIGNKNYHILPMIIILHISYIIYFKKMDDIMFIIS